MNFFDSSVVGYFINDIIFSVNFFIENKLLVLNYFFKNYFSKINFDKQIRNERSLRLSFSIKK